MFHEGKPLVRRRAQDRRRKIRLRREQERMDGMDMLQSLNEKLRRREKIFGFMAQLRDPHVLPGYRKEGVDFILYDLEHGPSNGEQIGHLLQMCRMLDLPTIIRVQDAVYHLISKVIDLGGDGILLPRTETLEQVRTAVGAVRFAPIGKKGCGGTYQFRKSETFDQFQNSRILLLQIESPLGVKNLPEILDAFRDEVAGIVIGPYDMSVQAGTPLEIRSPAVEDQIRRAIGICGEYEKSVGIFCDGIEEARRWRSEGMNLLWIGADTGFLNGGLSRMIRNVAEL
jgi:4-hydroxy-2-oxoheptanedioate aldolase